MAETSQAEVILPGSFGLPRQPREGGAGSLLLAVVLHLVLLCLAVWMASRGGPLETDEEPALLIMLAATPAPEPPAEPPQAPPPPAAPPPAAESPPAPAASEPAAPAAPAAAAPDEPVSSFKQLAAPEQVPDHIPPSSDQLIQESDFSGIGRGGVRADSTAGGASGTGGVAPAAATGAVVGDGPFETPWTVAPQLRNAEAVSRALQAGFARLAKDLRIQGIVILWVRIDERGNVIDARIKATSGYAYLDDLGLQVAHRMRFSPASHGDQRIKAWVTVPLVFENK